MPSSPPPSIDRVAIQLGVVRQLALHGHAVPARRLCGGLFLDKLIPIMRDPALLESFTECLLLLEMTALLPRLVRAVFGVELDVAKRGGAGARHWTASFGNGVTLLIPEARALLGRDGLSLLWARNVLTVAAADAAASPAPRERVAEAVV